MFPARVTSESERDFTGAWADKWDSRHFFADHPPFANHAGNVVKSPLLLLLHQLSILRCDLFTYVPSDKIYRNWKCRRYVCPFHVFFIFLLCSKLLFPPFPLHCQPPSGDSSSLPFASPPRESSLLFIATTLFTVPKLFHCREYEKERGSQKNFSTERMRECSFVVQTVGRRLAVCNSFSFRETEAVRLGFDRGLRANNSI